MTRQDGRAFDELRPIKITPDFVKFAEAAVSSSAATPWFSAAPAWRTGAAPCAGGHRLGDSGVLHAAQANRERSKRDIAKLKLSPRGAEIQRLVGRSLRAAVDLAKLGEHTITIDCDVLQGDGGTRTASVTGGFVALALACRKLVEEGVLASIPSGISSPGCLRESSGETLMLDLQYSEDSRAQVDLNCVMNELGEIIELQGTGEGRAFTPQEQQELVRLCAKGQPGLLKLQREILKR